MISGQPACKEFTTMLNSFNITHQPTIAYNPRENSLVERIHREVNSGIRIYGNLEIEIAVAKIAMGQRSTYHRSLGTCPTSLTFGRNKFDTTKLEDQKELRSKAREITKAQKDNASKRANYNKKHFAFLSRMVMIRRVSDAKQTNPYTGPFLVVEEKSSSGIARIDMGNKLEWRSYRRLRLFEDCAGEDSIVSRSVDPDTDDHTFGKET